MHPSRWLAGISLRTLICGIGLSFLFLSTVACGNGGRIDFDPGFGTTEPTNNKPTSFNMVPASKALVIESGKNVNNGYHAKVQLNPVKGLKMTATTGHSATMKYTVRNR